MSTFVIIAGSIGLLAMFIYMIREFSGNKNKKVNH